MDIETITYDNYTFKIDLDTNQIKLNMTDNTLMEIYEGTVKEDELYVKPIKKFYSMIIRSLNKEPSFNFAIDNRNSKMVCTVSYSTDMVDIEEHIILNKISSSESRELLLMQRINELENMLTPIFGINVKTGEYIKFKLDSKVLDFRIFNLEFYMDTCNKYELFNTSVFELLKFTNVKKIIYDTKLSPIYYLCIENDINNIYGRGNYYLRYINYSAVENVDVTRFNQNLRNIFAWNDKLVFPSVTEIEVYVNDKLYQVGFHSFPNLEKISIINNGLSSPTIHEFDLLGSYLCLSKTIIKKLNHVIIKNIWVTNEEKSRQYAKKHNIKLDII